MRFFLKDGRLSYSYIYTSLQKAIVMLVGCNIAFVSNAVVKFSADNCLLPYIEGDKIYIPLEFLLSNMKYDDLKSLKSCNCTDFISTDDIELLLNKKVIYKDGLIIIFDNEVLLDLEKDCDVFELLTYDLKKLSQAETIDDKIAFEKVFGFEGRLLDDPRFSYKMPYRLFIPEDYDPSKKYPFLLALHGFGCRGDDNLKQISELAPQCYKYAERAITQKDPCIILAPQCIEKGRTVFFDPTLPNRFDERLSYTINTADYAKITETESYRMAMQLFYNTIHKYNIDMDRLYITGHSMGGFSTFYFATVHNDLFAAAMPISGASDPSFAELLSKVAVWSHHGDMDNIVPVSGSRIMHKALVNTFGAEHKYTEYAGAGHDVYTDVFNVDSNSDGISDAVDWMLKQRKVR